MKKSHVYVHIVYLIFFELICHTLLLHNKNKKTTCSTMCLSDRYENIGVISRAFTTSSAEHAYTTYKFSNMNN